MRIRKNRYINDEEEMQMTPMIDIVFQLLIFFLLSAKFIALEGQLASYLPKDKGTSTAVAPQELVNVLLDLTWEGNEETGEVVCRTIQYRQPGTGAPAPQYQFGSVNPTVGDGFRYGPERTRVSFTSKEADPYVVPDFVEIEEYLGYRKETYTDPDGTGLPVTVNFDDKVPVQCVTVLLDICQRLGIQDFTLNAKEKEIGP